MVPQGMVWYSNLPLDSGSDLLLHYTLAGFSFDRSAFHLIAVTAPIVVG